MAYRNAETGAAVAAEMREEFPDVELFEIALDLESLASVRGFVKEFEALNLPLHILINNAGVFHLGYRTTNDGFESCFGMSCVGVFPPKRPVSRQIVSCIFFDFYFSLNRN